MASNHGTIHKILAATAAVATGAAVIAAGAVPAAAGTEIQTASTADATAGTRTAAPGAVTATTGSATATAGSATATAGGATPGAVTATAAPTSAEASLDAAVASLHGASYNLNGTAGSTASGGSGQLIATGSVNSSTKSAAIDFKGTEGGNPINVGFIQTSDALYAKLSVGQAQSQLGVGANQWLKVDESKITNPHNIPFDLSGKTDALDIDGLLTSVSNVKYPNPSDPTMITGTVDLTAATGVGAPDAQDVSKAGAPAKTTPFTATINGQGQLTGIKIDADGYDGDLSENIMFSDFGSPNPISPPASSIPAPEVAYSFFNS